MDRYFHQETARPISLLQRTDISRVVVFRALQLGDMLCAVPALRALRAALPNAHIALVGLPWAQQFAARFSHYIDAFHSFPGHHALPEQPVREDELAGFYRNMQAQKYSLALQLHGSGEISNGIVKQFGAQLQAGYVTPGSNDEDGDCYFPYPASGPESLRLLELMQLLGARDDDAHLEFPLLQEDWDELDKSGKTAGLLPGGYICIHPGARFRDKCWPPQRFAETADKLSQEFGLQVVLTGSHKEADLTAAVARHMKTPAIDTASPLSIGAMAALMSGARLLVCNDTGVSHIAAGLRLKSVVIFNKADIDRWAPLDHRLHRCLWDPKGEKADEVLTQARLLLSRAN
ncbi:MAG TPA: glycosyltransferase family 9 protein [Herminiimonas sp.]|nr:glycosyltransferase family 9 protein [Herminiimonas sp.]